MDKSILDAYWGLYRKQRPHLFSDSYVEYAIPLTKELFAFQLSQLSTDKKQSLFEKFILRTAGRIMIPNIRPQTGPDGGGDGKVDGDTYYVAPEIARKAIVGEDGWEGKEIAIAISCKKVWKDKVQSDVQKIVGTGRGYSRVLFFSNQKIKSSLLHETEDALRQQYGIPVQILDGSWCENAVFEKGCKDIALEELGFSDEYKQKREIIGPEDRKRQIRLDELTAEINAYQVQNVDTNYVDLLEEYALLVRGLGRPREDVENAFGRVIRESRSVGSSQQQYNLLYELAWTRYHWFHDVDATYTLYLELKQKQQETSNVTRIEKLTNILTLLFNVSMVGLFDEAIIVEEISYLQTYLDGIKDDEEKKSSALYLRIYLAEHEIMKKMLRKEPVEDAVCNIIPLIKESVNHLELSIETEYEIISHLGTCIYDNQEFEDFIDWFSEEMSNRDAEISKGRIQFDRGCQLLGKGDFVEAIRHFGHCIRAMEKEESKGDLVKATGMMAEALSGLELMYSAEVYYVRTLSLLMQNFYETGSVPHLLITVLQRLCDIELFAGRFVMYLNWRELLWVVSNNGAENLSKDFLDRDNLRDSSWACRFAGADLTSDSIALLPDILDRNGMPVTETYLKVALGYKELVSKEIVEIMDDDLQEKMLEQPVQKQFVGNLKIAKDGETYIETTVLDCRFIVRYPNTCEMQVVAEMWLASIEILFATLGFSDVIIHSTKVEVKVEEGDKSELVACEEGWRYVLRVVGNSIDEQELWMRIVEFIVNVLSKNAATKADIMHLLMDRQKKEALMDRVSGVMRYKSAIRSVLGDSFKNKIEDWIGDGDRKYPCLVEAVGKNKVREHVSVKQSSQPLLRLSSDVSLWDRAKWRGCGFLIDSWGTQPPIIGPTFLNIEVGKQIVAEWKELANQGKPNVAVYFLLGIDAQNPYSYRVCFAPDIERMGEVLDTGRYVALVSRKHTMTPTNSVNMDMFRNAFDKTKMCLMMAMEMTSDNKIVVPKSFADSFPCTRVQIKYAWEVSCYDEAFIALEPDDNPYIPEEHIADAPVLKALESLKDIGHRKL